MTEEQTVEHILHGRPLTMSCDGPVCRPTVRLSEMSGRKFYVIHSLTLSEGKKVSDFGWEYRELPSGIGLCCPRCIEFLDKGENA